MTAATNDDAADESVGADAGAVTPRVESGEIVAAPRSMTMPSPPPDELVELLLAWPGKLAEEILLAPWTIARARYALTELPAKIDELSDALDRTTTSLDATVDNLATELIVFKDSIEELLPPLSALVTGMDGRVERLETMMRDLGDSVTGALGMIPGMKRRIQNAQGAPRADHRL